MKIFTVKYIYCWQKSKPVVAAIAAEDFAEAKKKLRTLLSENTDIVGYLGVEAWVDEESAIDFKDTLTEMRKAVPELAVNEYVVKDIIE